LAGKETRSSGPDDGEGAGHGHAAAEAARRAVDEKRAAGQGHRAAGAGDEPVDGEAGIGAERERGLAGEQCLEARFLPRAQRLAKMEWGAHHQWPALGSKLGNGNAVNIGYRSDGSDIRLGGA
jgi:hypothetical protein